MKKIFCILISILCIASLLCACSKNEKTEPSSNSGEPGSDTTIVEDIPLDTNVVGTWTYVDAEGKPVPDMKGWVFNEDKTGVDTVFDLTFTYETQDGYIVLQYDDETLGKIETEYKYIIKDSLLTMKRDANGAESFTYMKEGPN